MFARASIILAGAGLACALAGVGFVQGLAVPQEATPLQPDEAVHSIGVEITTGAGGQPLNEPVALDLGLGFPLWLSPIGRGDGMMPVFGAVPQNGSGASVPPGETVRFQFTDTGDPGQDLLLTSPQLLTDLKVGDITRIGFASHGNTEWILGGYRIEVNGRTLSENAHADVSVAEQQAAARHRLTEIAAEIGTRQAEIRDLQALLDSGLSSETDQQRLAELQIEIAPQILEDRQLNGQLQGTVPWFVDGDFHPEWTSETAVRSLSVTVVTAPHSGADSGNFVYFQTGGHKYLLGSPTAPVSPVFGPQEFVIDVALSPMSAGDIRGFSLGMLASGLPQGDAPDRWHPQRLIVELEDRVIYDSEENPVDSSSLSAIRIIPPAHRNAAGEVVHNTPNAREAVLWQAGRAQGLDLVNGGAAELPSADSPDAPLAEPGLSIENSDVIIAGDDVIITEGDGWYDPGAGPFPGECDYGPEWMPGPPWPPGWIPGWGPAWPPGLTWQDLLMLGILEELGLLPDWVVPDPVGVPPQIEEVTFDTVTHTFQWEVTGDTSQIHHFVAEIQVIRPDLDVPFVASVTDPLILPAAARSVGFGDFVMHPLMPTFDEASRYYQVVRVTLIPIDPAIGVDVAFSPAFPSRTTDPLTHLTVTPMFNFEPLMGVPVNLPVSFGGDPGVFPASVWVEGQHAAHNGLTFAGFSPMQHHIAVRPHISGDHLSVEVRGELEGRYRLIAFVGFLGALETPSTVNVGASCLVYELANPANLLTYTSMAHLSSDPLMPPAPMQPVIIDIDTPADLGPGHMGLVMNYHLNCIAVDPAHPPVLTGVRLIEAP